MDIESQKKDTLPLFNQKAFDDDHTMFSVPQIRVIIESGAKWQANQDEPLVRDLYEALELLVEVSPDDGCAIAKDMARAALKKARGEA